MRRVSLVIVVCLLLGFAGGYFAKQLSQPRSLAEQTLVASRNAAPAFPTATAADPGASPAELAPAPARGPVEPDGLLPDELVSVAVYENCNRSVVHIATRSAAMRSFLQVDVRDGSGSGSILNRDGMILTNQHVIDGAREISVSLHNGLTYPAVLVGQDPDTDIAILKIDAPADELLPLSWGSSHALRVGHRIYAIGNPFGLERTMSTGMISSLNRQIPSRENRTMRSLIQIDASINPGNSGGPLLNTRGELIGMNTAIMSSSGDSAGVGFAIPIGTLQRIVPQLIQNGRVLRPSIGITRVYETDKGLLIVNVASGGPAEKAGLRGFEVITKTFRQGIYKYEQNSIDPSSADLIRSVDGQPVVTADDLLAAIDTKQPGDVVRLTILRNGREEEIDVTLAKSE